MPSTLQSSKRFGGRRRTAPMSEINVTPLVDVMLVLLIVFMVTAPLLTVGVEVNLPKTRRAGDWADEPLAVSIDAKGRVYIQDSEVELDRLIPRLMAITENNPDVRVFIRGDAGVDYGRVMTVMGILNASGFAKVALITNRSRPGKNR